jgi:peptidoglycan L-alanyl-D-glutamate endopeptidase CwlK
VKKKHKKRIINGSSFLLALILLFWLYNSINDPDNPLGPKKDVPMPTSLHPLVKKKADQLKKKAAEQGIAIRITDGFRTLEEQDKLYQKGRADGSHIVTYAEGGESYHNYGLAVDFALELANGNIIWDITFDGNGNSKSDWMEVVKIAKHLGFEWGGDWKSFKDYPHLQMDFGLSIRELQWGKRPPKNE